MQLFRASLFYIGYWLSILFYGLLPLFLCFFPKKNQAAVMATWNDFILFWLKLCCGLTYEVKGNLQALPTPCVIVPNHQSPWETFVVQRLCFPLTTILKKELLSIPLFGWGLRMMDPIAINRGTPVQALKQIKQIGIQRLKEGKNVLVFPEGTRMPADQLGPFKRSAADMAKAANVPLVPMAHNAGHYWLNKRVKKNPGVIEVVIGDPITIGDQDTKQVMQDVQAWVQQQIDGMSHQKP